MTNENIEKSHSFIKSLKVKFKLFFKRIFKENDFFQNKIILWFLVLNIFSNICNWAVLFFLVSRLDGGIVLHYNVYFGVDDIGDWRRSFMLPAIGLVIFLANSFLALFFYKNKERIASYILLSSAFMAQLCLIIASISVILINY